MSIADLRKDYARHRLDEDSALADPVAQFRVWLDEAIAAQCPEPTAMALSTVDGQGRPSSRMVLLKGVDAGFVFYTNYESRKGRELSGNEHACLLFFWPELERQVRIEGTVQPVSPDESDAYYRSRPLPSRLGAWASPQSQPLSSAALVARVAEATLRHGLDPERPPFWGGYRLTPDRLELWQGRPSRLHDRLRYTREGAGWDLARLAP
jgi:pyridoxamine 5'-phosphate oxidase